jgi:hypothetical protein
VKYELCPRYSVPRFTDLNRGFKDEKSGGILKSYAGDGMSKESAKKKILEKWELKTS